MSWWELFRQATHEGEAHSTHKRELVTTASDKSRSSSSKDAVPNWSDNRDYMAARRYWNRSTTQ